MTEILISSSIDNTKQPSLFYKTEADNRPLLVGLHTWSTNRFNQRDKLLPLAKKHGWNLLLPEFRGPNLDTNPNGREACGSRLAKQDIIDAINYVIENYSVDKDNILLLGASGGGHMALLMAGYAPKLFRAIGSFVPIADLAVWHDESSPYAPYIEYCLGGAPSEQTRAEYEYRSPIYHAREIAEARLKIFSGKWDSCVPPHHGLDMYNAIFKIKADAEVYFEMFDGRHEMPIEYAERWLLSQMNGRAADETVTG